MPTIDYAMRRSLNEASTWDIISEGIKRSLAQRSIVSDASSTVTDVKTAFSSWDNCMSVTWCKWPLIAIIAVVSLIVIGVLWCIIRCLCCGLSCCCECCYCLRCCGNCMGCCDAPRNKNRKRYLDDPYIPPNHSENMGYQMQPPMKAPSSTFNMTPSVSAHPVSGPPQYAEFDVSRKGGEDALPEMPSWESGTTKKISIEEDSIEMNHLAKTATTPSVPDVATPAAAVSATSATGATSAFAARQTNASQGGYRGTSPVNSNFGPTRPQDPPYGSRTMTPGAMNQGRNTPGMNGRSTPGFNQKAAYSLPNGHATSGLGNQQGIMVAGAMAGGAYSQQSRDPYSQISYGQQNSAYAGPDTGYDNGYDNGYNQNAGYQNTQTTGYGQQATYGQKNLDTGYGNGYDTNSAMPSPQESAFHYDNPAYKQATSPTAQQAYNAYVQQDHSYGTQNNRDMTGGYGSQQQSYNRMPVQPVVNNPYGGQHDVYEMPTADYSGNGNSMVMQLQNIVSQQQQSSYDPYNPAANAGIQNTGGFDFNSGFSRPGTSSGQDIQRVNTPQNGVQRMRTPGNGGQTTYAAPRP